MKLGKKELEELQREKQEAMEYLKRLLQEGDTVYTVLRYISNTGLRRSVSVYVIKENIPIYLDWYVAKVIGWKRDEKHDGVIVDGVGTDVGFELVYNLSYYLFGNGYKLKHKWL